LSVSRACARARIDDRDARRSAQLRVKAGLRVRTMAGAVAADRPRSVPRLRADGALSVQQDLQHDDPHAHRDPHAQLER
jgi:hypothetical protein